MCHVEAGSGRQSRSSDDIKPETIRTQLWRHCRLALRIWHSPCDDTSSAGYDRRCYHNSVSIAVRSAVSAGMQVPEIRRPETRPSQVVVASSTVGGQGRLEDVRADRAKGVESRAAVCHGIVFVGTEFAALLRLLLETLLLRRVGVPHLHQQLLLADCLSVVFLDDHIAFVPRGKPTD